MTTSTSPSTRTRTRTRTRTGWSGPSSLSLSKLALAGLVALSGLVATADAKYECNQNLGTYYPYCVNVPDNLKDGETMPTIVFLSGSGARGPASNVKSLSGYDGFGKLINQYLGGNKGADQVMAAEQFVTIIPISPQNDGGQEVRHWWPQYLDKVYEDVKSKGYPVDWSKLHLSGYSMGARGTWRNAVANPNMYASLSPSAGAAEKAGDATLSQQKADPVWPLLDKIKDVPVMQFGGANDNTAGITAPRATEAELKKIGSSVAQLVVEQTDHSGMSTQPFNAKLMNWMLEQSGTSGSSSSSSGKGSSSSDDDEEDSDSDSTPSKTGSSSGTKGTILPSSGSSSSSSSSSGSKGSSISPTRGSSGKVKCKRSRKAKRSIVDDGAQFAHPGPVRRGVYDSEIPHSSPRLTKRAGLTLASILENQKSSRKGEAPTHAKRTPLESIKAHAQAARAHTPNLKLGRRSSR